MSQMTFTIDGMGAPALPSPMIARPSHDDASDCTIYVTRKIWRRAKFIRDIGQYGWCEVTFDGRLLTCNSANVVRD